MSQSSVPSTRERKPRGWLVFSLKACVAGTLLWWLVAARALDVESLGILLVSPRILAWTLGTWLVVSVLLSTWRWRFFLEASGVSLPFRRTAALQLMALFFNSVVPGNVGGDVVKNAYVMPKRRAQIFVVVLGERIVGLFGLIWMGALLALVNLGKLSRAPGLRPVLLVLFALTIGTLMTPWLLQVAARFASSRAKAREAGEESSLASALLLFHEKRSQFLKAWLVSLLLHCANMLYFLTLTRELGNPAAELGRVALVYPLGMMTLAIPISLSGLGVGHVAFQKLFELVSLENGANVFNVFIVGALAPCLLGAIPYLFLRAERSAPRGEIESPELDTDTSSRSN